jgi:hypothetical protein
MLTAKITRDIREDVHSVANSSVAGTDARSKATSVCDDGPILTYDLEAMAGQYRTVAAKRLVRRLFRMISTSQKRQTTPQFALKNPKRAQ